MPLFKVRTLLRLKLLYFFYASLVAFEQCSARSLLDSQSGFITGQLRGMSTQENAASDGRLLKSTMDFQTEAKNLESPSRHGTTLKRKADSHKSLLRDALLVLGAVIEESLVTEEEKMSSEIEDFDKIGCSNNISYLPGEMLHKSLFHQERVINLLQDFMEEYAAHYSTTQWSLFSSRYREDLDTHLVPLLGEFKLDGTAATRPFTPHSHAQGSGRAPELGEPGPQHNVSFLEKLTAPESKYTRDVEGELGMTSDHNEDVLFEVVLSPSSPTSLTSHTSPSSPSSPTSPTSHTSPSTLTSPTRSLDEVLSSHLGHVYLTTGALEHVMLGDALVGEKLLLRGLQKVLGELGRLSRHLKKCLRTCGRHPPQSPIRDVITTPFEQVNYDGRLARAVRTLRHAFKMLKYFNESLLLFQKANDRKFFSAILPDLVL